MMGNNAEMKEKEEPKKTNNQDKEKYLQGLYVQKSAQGLDGQKSSQGLNVSKSPQGLDV